MLTRALARKVVAAVVTYGISYGLTGLANNLQMRSCLTLVLKMNFQVRRTAGLVGYSEMIDIGTRRLDRIKDSWKLSRRRSDPDSEETSLRAKRNDNSSGDGRLTTPPQGASRRMNPNSCIQLQQPRPNSAH